MSKGKMKEKLLEAFDVIQKRLLERDQSDFSISPEILPDETDHAAAVIQQNMALRVAERDRFLLREISHALKKFEDGTFGLCEETEEEIDLARLEAEPWARLSVSAQEAREKKAMAFSGGRRSCKTGL